VKFNLEEWLMGVGVDRSGNRDLTGLYPTKAQRKGILRNSKRVAYARKNPR